MERNIANLPEAADALNQARIVAKKLVQLLCEDVPDGDELKNQWYEVNRTIRPALAAIREIEGQTTQSQQLSAAGIG